METRPEPLTPPECDLRGYGYMPLFGNRLFGSRLYTRALRNPRAGLAAIKLWWSAWQQCPAGSLPNDDHDLAVLADFGSDLKGWKAVRDLALYGFVECADGRLYHPILAEEAVLAFEKRRRERDRKANMRAERARKVSGEDGGCPADVPRDRPRTHDGTADGTDEGRAAGRDADVRSDRTGQDRTVRKKEGSELRSGTVVPLDVRSDLFRTGLDRLRALTGKPESPCRAFLGRMLRDLGDDAAVCAAVLVEAERLRPADPTAWLVAAVRSRSPVPESAGQALRRQIDEQAPDMTRYFLQ